MMNNKQLDYNLIISPNLKFEQFGNSFRVKNEFNGNMVIFENNTIQHLLDYFSQTRKISEALDSMDGDIDRNIDIIKKLIEWDFLIVDLGLIERICPLCKSNNNHLLIEHENNYYQKVFKYVKCDNCSFVYLNPAPTEIALNFFYSFRNYYSVIPVNSKKKFEKKLQIKSNILRTNLLQDYYKIDEKSNILDVGSGTGNFSSYLLKRYNCNVTCVDKDPLALSFINTYFPSIKTIETDFKQSNIDEKFDLITMWGYIEHEQDPMLTIKKAYELLVPNGVIIIDAPNIDGTLAKKSLLSWPYLHSPYHLCHFEPNTLKQVLEHANFNIMDLKFKKTGSFLLKYSDFVLYLIYKYQLFYSSSSVDYFFYLLSKILRKGEPNSDSRVIIIGKKM